MQPLLNLLWTREGRIRVGKNVPVDILGIVMGVANTQPGAEGIATDEPAIYTQLLANLFELPCVGLERVVGFVPRRRRAAMPPKIDGNGLTNRA